MEFILMMKELMGYGENRVQVEDLNPKKGIKA
jgi:hypothetical protein